MSPKQFIPRLLIFSAPLLAAALLPSCGRSSVSASNGGSAGTESVGLSSFTNRASSGVVIFDGSSSSSLSNSLGTIGDTAGTAKRIVVSIPLTGLSGKTLQSATLNLYVDTASPAPVSALGQLRAYKIPAIATPVTASWGSAETALATIYSVDPVAVVSGTQISLDIKTALQASINAGDAYFTFKVRFANADSAGGNNQITFFVNYSSVPLQGYIPNITGTF